MDELKEFYEATKTDQMMDWSELNEEQKLTLKKSMSYAFFRRDKAVGKFKEELKKTWIYKLIN